MRCRYVTCLFGGLNYNSYKRDLANGGMIEAWRSGYIADKIPL